MIAFFPADILHTVPVGHAYQGLCNHTEALLQASIMDAIDTLLYYLSP